MKQVIALVAVVLSPAFGAVYEEPRGNETYLQSYGKYAEALLAEDGEAEKYVRDILLPKLTLDWQLAEESYGSVFLTLKKSMYKISVPKDEDCNPWTELESRDKTYRATILKQIEDAADFLSVYHARMLARNNSLFKIRNVVICAGPRSVNDEKLVLDRFNSELKLRIGPRNLLGDVSSFRRDHLHPLKKSELRADWDRGAQWEKDDIKEEFIDAAKNPIRAYWRLINPIGDLRVLLREGMVKAVATTLQAIRALKEENVGLLIRSELLNTMGDSLSPEARKRIEALQDRDLSAILDLWQKKIASPESEGAMTMATFSAVLQKRMEKQKKIGITRTQRGFVNIENFHNIDVSFTTGDAKDFQEFVVVPETIDVNVDQKGFVNVSTTDVVDVQVALSALGTASSSVFKKATLKSVLKSLRLL